jgi:RNA polymerase sigma factor (sigma-70 family)
MASPINEAVQHFRRAVLGQDGAGLSDGQLLGRFVEQRDEAAAAALVRRHGPMVWGVCRRVLGHAHDAEDAFQATFLVLARRAASIIPREMVGNWLYGVAHQTALKARALRAKRRARERQVSAMPEPKVGPQDPCDDLRAALDQELRRLPEKYRAAIVLCDLEGNTRKEAAQHLGVPEGTLAARLVRARTMLRGRLARHGLAVSGGALATTLLPKEATAGVPTAVVSSTIQAMILSAAGNAAATGAISAKAAILAQGVMRAMLFTRLRGVITILLALAAAVGVVGLTYGFKTRSAPAPQAAPPAARGAGGPAAPKDPEAGGPWGAVAGRVVWAGRDVPEPSPVVPGQGQAECLKNGPIFRQDYVINPKNRGVRWAVVWLVNADDYRKPPAPVHPDLKQIKQGEVVLDQPCCQFEPRIVCLREGQTLIARNSGAVVHHIRILSPDDNPRPSRVMPPGDFVRVPDWKAAPMPSVVDCNLHHWMRAYIRVFNHPYFAVSDGDGHFKIAKAPAGKFRIVAWQESVGYLVRGLKRGDPVEIRPGGVTEVNFQVKPRD